MENRDLDKQSPNRDFETNWSDEPSRGSESSDMESERGRTGGSSDIEKDSDLGSDQIYGEGGSDSSSEH